MAKGSSSDSGAPSLNERGARDLLNHVIEYLQYLQYHQTVQTLLAERASKRSQLNNSVLSARTQSREARDRLRAEMLRKFDEGRRDDFFALWQQYVPASMLGLDFGTQKMEFYLQVFFSIYPALPSSSVLVVAAGPGSRSSSHGSSSRHELAQRMKAFKAYLEGRGAGLAHTAEFLPYYALPYVPQPEHHPSFEIMFQPRWVDEQRTALKAYLDSITSRTAGTHVPMLYVMYREHLAATDGVPRLSPRARAMRTSSRSHPHTASPDGPQPPGSSATSGGAAGGNSPPQLPPGLRTLGFLQHHQRESQQRGSPPDSAGGGSGGEGGGGGGDVSSANGTPSRRRLALGAAAPLPPKAAPKPPLLPPAAAAAAGPAEIGGGSTTAGAPAGQEGKAVGGLSDEDDDGIVEEDEDWEAEVRHHRHQQRQKQQGQQGQRGAEKGKERERFGAGASGEGERGVSWQQQQGRSVNGGEAADGGDGAATAVHSDGSIALSLTQLGLSESVVFRESCQLQLGATTLEASTLGATWRTTSLAAGALGRSLAAVSELLGGTTLDLDEMDELAAAAGPDRGARGRGGGGRRRMDKGGGGGGVGVSGGGGGRGGVAGLAPLDYGHVKKDLQGPDNRLTARLLQALRWRFTHSRPGPDRWALMASWIQADLLDCQNPHHPQQPTTGNRTINGNSNASRGFEPGTATSTLSRNGSPGRGNTVVPPLDSAGSGSLLARLAAASDPWVSVEATRLAAAIASDRMGRRYLTQSGAGAVAALVRVLQQQQRRSSSNSAPLATAATTATNTTTTDRDRSGKADDDARGQSRIEVNGDEHGDDGDGERATGPEGLRGPQASQERPAVRAALVGLQRLSLLRSVTSEMIRLGAVEWLVGILQDSSTASPTAIEYGTALLMNLCLRSAGRAAAEALAEPLLSLCEMLMLCDNEHVRTYVHGMLYSVLSRARVREVALTRGTAASLEEVARSGEPPFAAQCQHILRQLYMSDTERNHQQPNQLGSGDASDDDAAPDGDADEAEELALAMAGECGEVYDDLFDGDVDAVPEEILDRMPGEACGEELLCAGGYLAAPQEARAQLSAVRSSVAAAAAVTLAATGRTSLRGSFLLGTLPPGVGAEGPSGTWQHMQGQGQGCLAAAAEGTFTAPSVSYSRLGTSYDSGEEPAAANSNQHPNGHPYGDAGTAHPYDSCGDLSPPSVNIGVDDSYASGNEPNEPTNLDPQEAAGQCTSPVQAPSVQTRTNTIHPLSTFSRLQPPCGATGESVSLLSPVQHGLPVHRGSGAVSGPSQRGGGPDRGPSPPTSTSSSAAFVALATSASSSSILAMARALEASRTSSLGCTGGVSGSTSLRKRSAVRPGVSVVRQVTAADTTAELGGGGGGGGTSMEASRPSTSTSPAYVEDPAAAVADASARQQVPYDDATAAAAVSTSLPVPRPPSQAGPAHAVLGCPSQPTGFISPSPSSSSLFGPASTVSVGASQQDFPSGGAAHSYPTAPASASASATSSRAVSPLIPPTTTSTNTASALQGGAAGQVSSGRSLSRSASKTDPSVLTCTTADAQEYGNHSRDVSPSPPPSASCAADGAPLVATRMRRTGSVSASGCTDVVQDDGAAAASSTALESGGGGAVVDGSVWTQERPASSRRTRASAHGDRSNGSSLKALARASGAVAATAAAPPASAPLAASLGSSRRVDSRPGTTGYNVRPGSAGVVTHGEAEAAKPSPAVAAAAARDMGDTATAGSFAGPVQPMGRATASSVHDARPTPTSASAARISGSGEEVSGSSTLQRPPSAVQQLPHEVSSAADAVGAVGASVPASQDPAGSSHTTPTPATAAAPATATVAATTATTTTSGTTVAAEKKEISKKTHQPFPISPAQPPRQTGQQPASAASSRTAAGGGGGGGTHERQGWNSSPAVRSGSGQSRGGSTSTATASPHLLQRQASGNGNTTTANNNSTNGAGTGGPPPGPITDRPSRGAIPRPIPQHPHPTAPPTAPTAAPPLSAAATHTAPPAPAPPQPRASRSPARTKPVDRGGPGEGQTHTSTRSPAPPIGSRSSSTQRTRMAPPPVVHGAIGGGAGGGGGGAGGGGGGAGGGPGGGGGLDLDLRGVPFGGRKG